MEFCNTTPPAPCAESNCSASSSVVNNFAGGMGNHFFLLALTGVFFTSGVKAAPCSEAASALQPIGGLTFPHGPFDVRNFFLRDGVFLGVVVGAVCSADGHMLLGGGCSGRKRTPEHRNLRSVVAFPSIRLYFFHGGHVREM